MLQGVSAVFAGADRQALWAGVQAQAARASGATMCSCWRALPCWRGVRGGCHRLRFLRSCRLQQRHCGADQVGCCPCAYSGCKLWVISNETVLAKVHKRLAFAGTKITMICLAGAAGLLSWRLAQRLASFWSMRAALPRWQHKQRTASRRRWKATPTATTPTPCCSWTSGDTTPGCGTAQHQGMFSKPQVLICDIPIAMQLRRPCSQAELLITVPSAVFAGRDHLYLLCV